MAFHVACPITCRRICHCSLGFTRSLRSAVSKDEFLREVSSLEEFLTDPWGIKAKETAGTVQITVPKIALTPPPPTQPAAVVDAFGGSDGLDDVSAQAKRVALQKKAAAALVAAEEYARRFESGDLADQSGDLVEEQGLSNSKILCRMCLFGESEGSERAKKMLSCRTCDKKYHRSCLKNWSQHRDLFHLNSWACPSCRTCEICRRTGDPKKFMFCKRCDGAYHCYCQHPPHKNVSSGPYLCPKHTRCHSCDSNVPGNGLSVRWFLGYTCCDACGRLFVKGNYCPVCLKVYRDSESTPMVCCDLCQRWVHTNCDGISDEKYLQFQVDGNLQYVCAACRGECYQVKDLEDAVQELWRRKDVADTDLIASLRAAVGLPTQEEIYSISPYSDDDENPVALKNEHGRSLKLSFKGLSDKAAKNSKDLKKSSSKKKMKKSEELASCVKEDIVQLSRSREVDPAVAICTLNQPGVLNHKLDDVTSGAEDKKSRILHIKTGEPHNGDSRTDVGKLGRKSRTMNEKKLVIHLGTRSRNPTNSPLSDASSCQKEHDLLTSNGDGVSFSAQSKGMKSGAKGGNLIKLGKVETEVSDVNPRLGRGSADLDETNASDHPRLVVRKRSTETEGTLASTVPTLQTYRREKFSSGKKMELKTDLQNEISMTPNSQPPKESRPLLKLKFKNIKRENQQPSELPLHDEEKNPIKGQRSKRKRPSPVVSRTSFDGDEDADRLPQDNLLDEIIMDANWILKKLGKDAIGKRVEVHQPSDNSWHKGVVVDIVEGTSTLSVDLDDGRMHTVELGKNGIRFVSQKQKKSKK